MHAVVDQCYCGLNVNVNKNFKVIGRVGCRIIIVCRLKIARPIIVGVWPIAMAAC